MIGLTYTINDAELQKLAGEMAGRIERRQQAMEAIGLLARESVLTNFAVGGRPGWKALKYRSGSPLVDTGRLKNSITKQVASNVVIVGTNVVYAAIHNFGGKAGRNRKVTVPQREFMLLQDEDVTDIKDLLAEWIVEGRI